ncbi:hypothetical protein MHU86_21004 [Fragilaria crotonensis]|nr:hypothetical protein MHU86_21004 [Fragilaria crotonensis]
MAVELPTTPPPCCPDGSISHRQAVGNSFASSYTQMDANATQPQKRRRIARQYREGTKKVRFSAMHELREIPCEDDPDRRWFRDEELSHFRSRGKVLAMEISRNRHMEGNCLSYKNVIEGAYFHSLESSARFEPDMGLLLWIQHGHSRRGLERWSVPSIGWSRHDRRNALVQDVIFVQQNQFYDKDLVLRQLSEHYSAPGARFALAIAAADAHAVAAAEYHGAEMNISPNVHFNPAL